MTSQSHAMLTKQSSADWPYFVRMLSFPEVITQFSHQQLHDKVPKIHVLYSNRYSLIILHPLSVYHSYGEATAHLAYSALAL